MQIKSIFTAHDETCRGYKSELENTYLTSEIMIVFKGLTQNSFIVSNIFSSYVSPCLIIAEYHCYYWYLPSIIMVTQKQGWLLIKISRKYFHKIEKSISGYLKTNYASKESKSTVEAMNLICLADALMDPKQDLLLLHRGEDWVIKFYDCN